MIQMTPLALIVLLGLTTLRIVYLLGRASAHDELDHIYREYTRMANRLAAHEQENVNREQRHGR